MSKTYTLFKRMSPHLAKKARNLVDAMLMSNNEIGWDSEYQLIVNRKVYHGSDIVKSCPLLITNLENQLD